MAHLSLLHPKRVTHKFDRDRTERWGRTFTACHRDRACLSSKSWAPDMSHRLAFKSRWVFVFTTLWSRMLCPGKSEAGGLVSCGARVALPCLKACGALHFARLHVEAMMSRAPVHDGPSMCTSCVFVIAACQKP